MSIQNTTQPLALFARRTIRKPEALLVLLLAMAIIFGNLLSPYFLTPENLSNSAQSMLERALIVLPMTALVLAAEIDLSVASVMGLTGALLAKLIQMGMPLAGAIVTVLLIGSLLGLVNGVLVALVGLPSLIVTLGTLSLYRGLSYVVLGGTAFADFPTWFTDFGYGTIPGTLVPWPTLIFIPLAIGYFILLSRGSFGRIIYALGNNIEAVRFSGIRVSRFRVGLFVASSTIAALAGVVYTARIASARADNATGFELDVIAAVLLGGVSIFGGRGSLLGAVLGLILIGSLQNGLTLADVPSEAQSVLVGTLLVLSILAPNFIGRLASRARQKASAGSNKPDQEEAVSTATK